jgi:hypothetical protein
VAGNSIIEIYSINAAEDHKKFRIFLCNLDDAAGAVFGESSVVTVFSAGS